MSVLTDIADGVTAALNDHAFSEAFEAQRLHQPSFELAELQDLRVSVVPKSLEIRNAARQYSFFDCTVDIGLQQKVESDERVDELLGLAEEIADHLRIKRLPSVPQAVWMSIEHDPVVAAEHLDQHRQLTSVLSVTYRVKR